MVPISIKSNRGIRFTSKFWQKLHEELLTKLDLSIAFHPLADGRFKRTIHVLENMLWVCVVDIKGH